MNVFRYPTSQKLGGDCGSKPYPGAPNEQCDRTGCTPHLRFKDGDNDLAMSRKILKQSNNRQIHRDQLLSPLYHTHNGITDNLDGGLTPFRRLMNAGDIKNTHNSYVLGKKNCDKHSPNGCQTDSLYVNAINQVSSTRRASNGSAVRMGGSVPTTINEPSLWTGNNKWVYDGSDYVTFKKLQAKNRNFNDKSWGGDRHNASQVAVSRVRR